MEICSSLGFASTLPAVASVGKETLGKPRSQQKPALPCNIATQRQQKHTLVKPRPQPKTPVSCRIATQQPDQQQLLPLQELEAAGSASHPSRRGLLGLIGSLSLGTLFHDSSPAEASTAPSCDFTTAPSGLAFCDTSVGTGLSASKGMAIKANYVGKLEDGKVFDSSYDRGKPFTFIVGVGQVIKGWDEGILGGEGIPPMLAGGKRTLRIPSSLGYGERGAGCRGGSCLIPPNSVLLFDVEFIGKAY